MTCVVVRRISLEVSTTNIVSGYTLLCLPEVTSEVDCSAVAAEMRSNELDADAGGCAGSWAGVSCT